MRRVIVSYSWPIRFFRLDWACTEWRGSLNRGLPVLNLPLPASQSSRPKVVLPLRTLHCPSAIFFRARESSSNPVTAMTTKTKTRHQSRISREPFVRALCAFYYMEESVLLGTKPLVDFIRHFIRDPSGVFSVCHLCECRIVQWRHDSRLLLLLNWFLHILKRTLHVGSKIWILCSRGKNNISLVRFAHSWDIVLSTRT